MLITREGSRADAAARSAGSSATVRLKMPSTFVCRTFSQPFSGNSSSGAPQVAPALLTRMSRVGNRSRVSVASSTAAPGSDTSPGIASHSPSSASSRAAALTSSCLREETITLAPASTRPRAIISPIPREPPVTRAVLPATSNRSSIRGQSLLVGEVRGALVQERLDRLGHRAAEGRHDLLAVLVLDRRLLRGDLERAPHPPLGEPHAPGGQRGDLRGRLQRVLDQAAVAHHVGHEADPQR